MKTFNNIKSTNRYYYTTTETDKEDNRIYLHRKLVEEHIGRKLLNHEHVHHLDFDKSHNAFSNLLLCDRSSHIKLHNIIKSFTLTSKEEGRKTFAEIIQPTKETVELLLGRQLLNDEEYYSFVDNPEYLNISKIIIIHKAFKSNLLRWLGQYKLEFKENTELSITQS